MATALEKVPLRKATPPETVRTDLRWTEKLLSLTFRVHLAGGGTPSSVPGLMTGRGVLLRTRSCCLQF